MSDRLRAFIKARTEYVEGYSAALDDLESWAEGEEAAQPTSLGDHSLPEVDAVRERQRQATVLWEALDGGGLGFEALNPEVRNRFFAAVDRLQASRPPTPHEAALRDEIESLDRSAKALAVRLRTARASLQNSLEWAREQEQVTFGMAPAMHYAAFALRLRGILEELGE